jgi:hypothetical protein
LRGEVAAEAEAAPGLALDLGLSLSGHQPRTGIAARARESAAGVERAPELRRRREGGGRRGAGAADDALGEQEEEEKEE